MLPHLRTTLSCCPFKMAHFPCFVSQIYPIIILLSLSCNNLKSQVTIVLWQHNGALVTSWQEDSMLDSHDNVVTLVAQVGFSCRTFTDRLYIYIYIQCSFGSLIVRNSLLPSFIPLYQLNYNL